ncbi:MAG: hypothetical protein Fur005_02660 [Roseiflexaceae bacterium]
MADQRYARQCECGASEIEQVGHRENLWIDPEKKRFEPELQWRPEIGRKPFPLSDLSAMQGSMKIITREGKEGD